MFKNLKEMIDKLKKIKDRNAVLESKVEALEKKNASLEKKFKALEDSSKKKIAQIAKKSENEQTLLSEYLFGKREDE